MVSVYSYKHHTNPELLKLHVDINTLPVWLLVRLAIGTHRSSKYFRSLRTKTKDAHPKMTPAKHMHSTRPEISVARRLALPEPQCPIASEELSC